MSPQTWLVPLFASLLGPALAAAEPCSCRFEVSAASGTIRPVRRATSTAAGGVCTFDVRLRVAAQEAGACDGASARLRGLGGGVATVDPWAMPWEQVTVRAKKSGGVRRRLLRARIQGTNGGIGRARLALRCEAAPVLEGCEAVLAEPTYCFIGGGAVPRVVGFESGAVCGQTDDLAPLPMLQVPSLAVWQGDAWTCGGSSPAGGFVTVPLEGTGVGRVAGPCAATGTDGDALLVLPRPGFDAPLPPLPDDGGPMGPVFISGLPPVPHDRAIRAYDLRDDVPGGPYRTAFDLDTIPEGSPCGAMIFDTITGQDGIVYAAGCTPSFMDFSGCSREPFVCVFDTNTGATRPPLVLQGFTGTIRGMSAVPGGRLMVLTDDSTQLPPIGYVDSSVGPPVGNAQIHVFDVTDGSRLDSKPVFAGNPIGLACFTQ